MTLAQAQTAAANLRTALLDNGVRQVSIELQPGVAGSGWGVAPFKRVLGHHIASYPPGTPGLGLVKKGRTGANALTGPLANCYGGFDMVARIITLGWANHPGTGGPWSVPGWGTVPKDNGRPYVLGWEFEGGYLLYTDEMHDFMARCGAGSLDWLGTLPGNPGPAPLECHDEHKGWAGPRKPDRIGYTTASGRARIAAVRGTNPMEDDMPLTIEDLNKISEYVWRAPLPEDHGVPILHLLAHGAGIRNIEGVVGALLAGSDIDEEKLAAALAPTLVPAILAALPDTGLTEGGVEEAVRRVLRSLQSSLDAPPAA